MKTAILIEQDDLWIILAVLGQEKEALGKRSRRAQTRLRAKGDHDAAEKHGNNILDCVAALSRIETACNAARAQITN